MMNTCTNNVRFFLDYNKKQRNYNNPQLLFPVNWLWLPIAGSADLQTITELAGL